MHVLDPNLDRKLEPSLGLILVKLRFVVQAQACPFPAYALLQSSLSSCVLPPTHSEAIQHSSFNSHNRPALLADSWWVLLLKTQADLFISCSTQKQCTTDTLGPTSFHLQTTHNNRGL